MSKILGFEFWNTVARIILRNRILILVLVLGATVFLGTQWQHMRFSQTEANLLPDDDEINLEYNEFVKKFGEEGNVILMAVQDSSIFSPEKFAAWNELARKISSYPEVTAAIFPGNLPTLQKLENPSRFELLPLVQEDAPDSLQIEAYKEQIFNRLPFYEGLVYAREGKTLQTAIYLDKEIVNTIARKDFVLNDFAPLVDAFEEEHNIDVRVSGMPYIRTMNSNTIIGEIGLFIGGALLVTSLIFFLFFRSLRATLISILTVIIGVMWTFGFLGLFNFEITVLTAVIPPLIIVIGIPNCIFLINKYQKEIQIHGNQAKSLQRVITKVGNATLMTNATTASGFATFMFIESSIMKEFGMVASINIISIFFLSLLIIPILYSFMPVPKERHLEHLNRRWIEGVVNWIEEMVKNRRITIYITALVLMVGGIVGAYKIKVTGSLLEDMPKNTAFFNDILFFEEEFDGVLPLEILIDTKREDGVMKLSTLKRMERLEQAISEEKELSNPLSVVRLAKYAKQAYYNGNPKYYQLPTSQEQAFLMPYLKNMEGQEGLLNSLVDSTGRYARITTFMKDIGTKEMEKIEAELWPKIQEIFPEDRYEISMTGKALVFQKGTTYLVRNLFTSLGLTIILIALFMAWMFRSFRMILVSLIPNLLPLLLTGGLMGYLGIPIKPSTILVFSIAFGISVDDTIHFLAKYRQELKANNWKIKRSIYAALRETGVSMFYTSIVLFFGFSVFMISSFGGTVALGGLVSATLLFAMLSNLLLLPSLLLSLEKRIANKEILKEPALDILSEEDEVKK